MPDNNYTQKFFRFIRPAKKRKLNVVNFIPNFGSMSILTIVIKIKGFCLIIINKKTIYS